ncbi:MAG: RidA family protein [Rhodospirillales bacterium]|jgi:2-iminobutanoate/2-iminopropanoate deaminase
MKIVHSDDAPKAIGPYSQGIYLDGWFFSSGQIPLDLQGEKIDGDIESQTTQVFKNLKAVLGAAGLTLNDVVKATVFVTNLDDFTKLNSIYENHFGTHKPARSTVQVARLPLNVDVEIEVIAKKP